VEEVAAVHVQAAAAQAPVRTEQEVKFEDAEMLFIQIPFCQEIKVSHVFFVFATPDAIAFLTGTGLKGGAAQVLGFIGAFSKLGEAGTENAAERAITGFRRPMSFSAELAQSLTLAVRTRCRRSSNCFRTIPLHLSNILWGWLSVRATRMFDLVSI
jgi:hypothetical protein